MFLKKYIHHDFQYAPAHNIQQATQALVWQDMGHHALMSDSTLFDGGDLQLVATGHEGMDVHDVQIFPITLRKPQMMAMDLDVIAEPMCLISC